MPSPITFPSGWNARTLSSLRSHLLSWFDANQRDLPWRASRDPYRIWVSEVMLQQTTVAAVVPYFERFLTAYPTLNALAAAEEQAVLKLWEGLGYYRRARHLHAAAKRLAEHDHIPEDPELWADLPGVGRYILGAVLSQAFDQRLPIVEANSLRVLARLFGYCGDPREGEGKQWVWQAAEATLPAKRAGDFNQALMELGALVCTPIAPDCRTCPLRAQCVANRQGLQEEIPPKKQPKDVLDIREVAIVIRDRGGLLLCQRGPDAPRWQNMWEVPHGERLKAESVRAAAVRIARELTGLTVELNGKLPTIRHTVTRHAITMECIEASRIRGRFRSALYVAGKWVTTEEMANYPVSTPQRKLMTAAGAVALRGQAQRRKRQID